MLIKKQRGPPCVCFFKHPRSEWARVDSSGYSGALQLVEPVCLFELDDSGYGEFAVTRLVAGSFITASLWYGQTNVLF